MKGTAVRQLTNVEFDLCRGTELYAMLLAHKFHLEFENDAEIEALFRTINAVASGPWYQEPLMRGRLTEVKTQVVYVTCPEAEDAVLGALGLLP